MHPQYQGQAAAVTRQAMTGGKPAPVELATFYLCKTFPALSPIRSPSANDMLPYQRMIFAAIARIDDEIREWRRKHPEYEVSSSASDGVSSVQAPVDPENPFAAFQAGNWGSDEEAAKA